MFEIEESSETPLNADIRVVGVGGGGGNAVETMIQEGIRGVKFITVNTDAQALSAGAAETKIQLGAKLTKGLGAGANPEIGRRAAIESYEEIVTHLKGADMVFITAGMGGGTGTGGIPVIAEAAREQGVLTVGVVTTPFLFEGNKRKKRAEKGIAELKSHLDTLIIIPNEKLLSVFDDDTPLLETFKKTDEVLLKAVKGLAELISLKGLINLDFADVKTVMTDKGMALMGVGTSGGKNRAERAVTEAVSSPLLSSSTICGATGVIVNITAGAGLSLREINEISSLITKSADPEADIIVGAVIDENMADRISVTLIATGFKETKTLKSLSPPAEKEETRSSPLPEEKTREPKGLSLVPPTDLNPVSLPPRPDDKPETIIPLFDREGGGRGLRAEDDSSSDGPSESTEESCDQNPSPPAPAQRPAAESATAPGRDLKIKTSNERGENPNSIKDLQEGEPSPPRSAPLPKNSESNNPAGAALTSNEREEDFAKKTRPKEDSKEEKDTPSSVRDMLLKKAREHALLRETGDKNKEKPSVFPQQQMSMSWPEEDLSEDLAESLSPFESDLSFSEEDLL